VPDPDYEPTRINGQIRKLLAAFSRSAYVGYTATPFANVLIHDAGVRSCIGNVGNCAVSLLNLLPLVAGADAFPVQLQPFPRFNWPEMILRRGRLFL
jgi:hypothetical protein